MFSKIENTLLRIKIEELEQTVSYVSNNNNKLKSTIKHQQEIIELLKKVLKGL